LKLRLPHTFTVSLLVAGNLVGAGILALPINTGLAGLAPSLLCMLLVGIVMMFSASVLSKEAIDERDESFNYPSLFHNHLGNAGKWGAILANLLILYGLMIAYLAGATAILAGLLPPYIPEWAILLFFFVIITALNLREMDVIRRHNTLLMFFMWGSFAIIVLLATSRIETPRLSYTDWVFLPSTIPIIVTAFNFHNIIPHICHSLEWDPKQVRNAIWMGVFIGYAMSGVWILVCIGAMPLDGGGTSIYEAFISNTPSTVPLSKIINNKLFTVFASIFSLLAISTSCLAVGISLMGFFEDLISNHLNKASKTLKIGLSFIPPLLFTLLYPKIFLRALNIVGGFGIVTLFGILPCIIAIKRGRSSLSRALGIVMLIIFSSFFALELAQETGWLKIKPQVEHWRHNIEHVFE
jgi:tyrosine-specific transport protein